MGDPVTLRLTGSGHNEGGQVQMIVEIWSDYMCPFCYIGKRHFETALAEFPHRDGVEVVWRSFQLNPDAAVETGGDLHDYVASKFGRSRAQAKALNDQMVDVLLRPDFATISTLLTRPTRSTRTGSPTWLPGTVCKTRQKSV